ncbi:E3 ubiquitin-protein ligase RBBP6-like [Mycteria americana]|uniref:E3 ubiquitin-protein ligase RBBP6-like n=1 Tax=Mycteria americana TaxID=33587 RepID=UPI003F586423
MSCVHYKFSSKMSYDTVTFSGLHISLCDLKRQIMSREKLKVSNCDLQITNAQTKEEYTDDNALIPRNSSVIVRRIPVGGVKATSKTYVISRSEPVSATSKAIDDPSAPISLAQLIQVYLYSRQELKEKKCIRTALLVSEEHTCPTCHQTDVSPDALIANKALRKVTLLFNVIASLSISVLTLRYLKYRYSELPVLDLGV